MNMRMRTGLLCVAIVATSLVLGGCHLGVGGHHNHHADAAPADHFAVQYMPEETVKTVKCPVCGGTGSLQKPYLMVPVPYHQHVSP
jgi:hypothetical protein